MQAQRPAKKSWGYLSKKNNIYIFVKKLKIVKTQATDFETEVACSIEGYYLVSFVEFASVTSVTNLVIGS